MIKYDRSQADMCMRLLSVGERGTDVGEKWGKGKEWVEII